MAATATYSRQELPLGSIRIREKNGVRVRMIKTRMDGPTPYRWKRYARWWWEQNRGPVPAGKRVCHMDGNTLNDEPSNYGLLTAGDVVYLWHEQNPKLSARNYEKCREATAAINRMRGMVNRQVRWLETRWYAVDFNRRVILNEPYKERWQVYAAHGVECGPDNWRVARSAALGWPNLPVKAACALACLSDDAWITTDDLLAAVNELRRRNRWAGISRQALYSAICEGRDYILGGRGRYRLNAHGAAARVKPCPIVPVYGEHLFDVEFKVFERVTAEPVVSE